MKIIITGGAGFLGYHLAQRMEKYHRLTLLDIDTYHPGEYQSSCVCAGADVRNKEALREHLTGDVDVVIHAAAALPLWKPEDIRTTSIDGTRNVLELAQENGIPRVVFISSTAVYGIPDKHPLREDDNLVGVGPYGESKIAAEKICESFRDRLVVPIIRPKTFIGTERLGVFQILYDWVRDGKRIPVIGNGKNRYQLLEVEDLTDAIISAATKPADVANATFNIGAKIFKTVNEDVGALCDYAATGARVMHTPARMVKPLLRLLEMLRLSPLYKWVYGTADKDSFVSIEKAEQQLNWHPKYTNADALIRSYQWYLDNLGNLDTEAFGVTHRVPWSQGMLKILKKFL